MKRITAQSTVEEVMSELGVGPEEKLRETSKRKNTLEKFAQMRSRNPKVTLSLKNVPTAFVKADEELNEFIDITVTTREFNQTITDLPQKYSDYLIQKAMASHEVGHVLYSDWPALEHFMNKVEEEEKQCEGVDESMAKTYKDMFANFYNVLEDGAIEKYLGEEFRLDEEILHLRATIHEDNYFGQEYMVEGDTVYHYPFFYVIMTAALNIGVYDNGELDKLIDEDNEKHIFSVRGGEVDREMLIQNVLPLIQSSIPKIHNKIDAWERAEEIYILWSEIKKYIDRSQTSGRMEFNQQQKHSESNSYIEGVPENISKAHGDQDKEPISIDINLNESGNKTFGQNQGDKTKENSEKDGIGNSEQKAQQGIINEVFEGDNDWSDEIENIINCLGAGDGTDEIAIADDGEVDHDRMQEAINLSKRTSRLFQRRLRQMNKDKVVRNKERGYFDSNALISAERGSTKIFKQSKKGKDKNYSCMIVLDRSGSMNRRIEEVELAAGAIAWGLEENGVDTSIIDTESSMTTLSKPFGTNVDSFKQKIFSGRCGGGTPLTHTMRFARQRMDRGSGDYPFVIVITDGRPYNIDSFKHEVKNANFPVLGLYLTDNSDVEDQLSLYDNAITCKSSDDVNQNLINLINSIIF